MKKIIFVLAMSIVTFSSFAQKISKKEIDKFTKSELIITSLEKLFADKFIGMGNGCPRFEFQIRKSGDNYSMPATISLREIQKYTDDSGVTFLLDNDETVSLTTNYTGISSPHEYEKVGYLFDTSFSLTPLDVEKLKTHKVVSIRIRYMGGHYDRNIKPKKQDLIMNSLLLVDQ